ncbi:MAG: O-antigen ligase family protein, partial [Candidatus Binatia bacterium]
LQVRLEVARQSLGIIRDFPVFGTGLGTWPEIFPRYQRYPLLFATIPHVHGDVLEWLSDIGALGFGLLCFLALRYARRVTRCSSDDRRRRRAILVAGIATIVFHAVGEFALRIPSNALGAFTLLGLLWRETGDEPPEHGADRPGASFGVLDRAVAVACLGGLVYLATSEWRDGSSMAADDVHPAAIPGRSSWSVYEQLAWRRLSAGAPATEAALRAVTTAPIAGRGHRVLAYCYRSAEMAERELARAIACEPANRSWRLEHALLLGALGRVHLAHRQVELGYYLNPQYGDTKLLEFEDPIDGTRPLLEAAIRGVRRRVAVSPEARHELARFEADSRRWRLEREQRRRGG